MLKHVKTICSFFSVRKVCCESVFFPDLHVQFVFMFACFWFWWAFVIPNWKDLEHIRPLKVLRLWRWDWVKESNLNIMYVHFWHDQKTEIWERTKIDHVWPNFPKRCDMREKKNLPFRPEHGMNFQNEKTWKKWKSSFDSLVSFFYGVYSANLVRNDFFPFWKSGLIWKFNFCIALLEKNHFSQFHKSGQNSKFIVVPSVFVFYFSSDNLVKWCQMWKVHFAKYQIQNNHVPKW